MGFEISAYPHLPPARPILGQPALMGKRDDDGVVFGKPIDQRVGETLENQFAGAGFADGANMGMFPDQ